MPTIREIAERCGVSKPTVTERLKDLGLWDAHVTKAGKAFEVDDHAAAVVADALKGRAAPDAAGKGPAVDDGVTVRELLAAQRDLARMYQDQLAAKDAQISTLMGQVADLTRQLAESRETVERLASRSWFSRVFGRALPPGEK